MANKKTSHSSHVGAITAGLAGLTAAAIGAYYLYGSDKAKKNRAIVKGWMLKAKGEVMEELEKAKEVTQDGYMSAVDVVAKKYNELKHIDPAEVEAFVGEMKSHWDGIVGSVSKAVKKTTHPVKAKSKKKSSKK